MTGLDRFCARHEQKQRGCGVQPRHVYTKTLLPNCTACVLATDADDQRSSALLLPPAHNDAPTPMYQCDARHPPSHPLQCHHLYYQVFWCICGLPVCDGYDEHRLCQLAGCCQTEHYGLQHLAAQGGGQRGQTRVLNLGQQGRNIGRGPVAAAAAAAAGAQWVRPEY